MTRIEFQAEIATILELSPDKVAWATPLADLEAWDSLAVLSFIAMADDKHGIQFSARQISDCTTVGDLGGLLGDRIS